MLLPFDKMARFAKFIIYIFLLSIQSSLAYTYSYQDDPILTAKNDGKYEAIMVWDRGGFDCSKVNQFVVLQRELNKYCERRYVNSIYTQNLRSSSSGYSANELIFACEVGVEEVQQEKIHSCNHHNCAESGKVLSRPVTAILCQYVTSPWSVEAIPESCIPQTEASCVEMATANINQKIDSNQCDNALVRYQRNEIRMEVQKLCDAFIHAYSTPHSILTN